MITLFGVTTGAVGLPKKIVYHMCEKAETIDCLIKALMYLPALSLTQFTLSVSLVLKVSHILLELLLDSSLPVQQKQKHMRNY